MRNRVKRWLLLALLAVASVLFLHIYRVEAVLSVRWVPDRAALLFSQRKSLPQPITESFPDSTSPPYQLPLRTKGRYIVDQTGRRFKLASINWYGGSDELFVPGGLDTRHRDEIALAIRRMGFNSVRLPYSDEMVIENPVVENKTVAANPDLLGARALDVFIAVAEALTVQGIAVIVNNHITRATWCCGLDLCDTGWANDYLPKSICRVRQTEEEWIQHWKTVMSRVVNNSLVIGADLRNEVRGLWGTMPWKKWAAAAEKAGNALLKLNPNWLIIVGGTESNNDLSGVAKRPIMLAVPNRVVYEAHVYSWSGWGSIEGSYSRRSYESFARSMRKNWAYLLEGDVAPVWVGEFGAPDHPNKGDANYWANLVRFLKEVDADFGYWALNPRKVNRKKDEREMYSLVEDDWMTPVLDYRLKDLTEIMGDRS
ncbi:uncharacterized protein CTHT_0056210 [Thermochaetoides thermophila DSM 1495]|uniref:Glycoside hydrolase family 5 domain-containing protein n=1 Tax=Chaetomium thermophilum (strain DSM 1495 / CBS 144.50 / IMI 039719) TaxID=759272 RepID=G0SC75_CHATD|nr:hypothetical protein CTHT_0056210 [Thermochaetoides thermophila DSM 1495]EGS19001.1 hypothetical protein CTHT_0056210 [Thermochaetoides thermophila DSM 1495]